MSSIVVVGNPENRRVELFRSAAKAVGLAVFVWPWVDVLSSGDGPTIEPQWVRVDSPGENLDVHQMLVGPGSDPQDVEPLGEWFTGFCAGLDRVRSRYPDAMLLNPVEEVFTIFDKAACHRRLEAAGIPVPEALPPIGSYDELRSAIIEAGWTRVFVKPSHGSSASGVIALATAVDRMSATTSIVLDRNPVRLRNGLGVRTYTDPADVAIMIDRLAPGGLHVERWYPKLGLGNRTVDLRIVVIAGEPNHVVVRSSKGPITNLHLGNARGDLAELKRHIGSEEWDALIDTCRRVGQLFPGSLHLGVDVMVASRGRGHAIAEVNAFGDLLPGIVHNGRSTYEAEVAALVGSVRT